METRGEYIERLASKLQEWDAKIDELKLKSEKVSPRMQTGYKQMIIELQEKRDEGADLLERLHESDETAWPDLKLAVDRLLGDMLLRISKAA